MRPQFLDPDYRLPGSRHRSMRDAVAEAVGRAVRQENGCLLLGKRGEYKEVHFSRVRMQAHAAVVRCRGDEIPDGFLVRHHCDEPSCIETTHLDAGTPSQNGADVYERNRRKADCWARGADRPNALIDEAAVCELRSRFLAGQSIGSLAPQYGMTYSSARMAIRGETWKHVTDVPPVPGRRNAIGNDRAYALTRPNEAVAALDLYDAGWSLAEVGVRLGVTRHTAWRLVQVARDLANTQRSAA